MEQNDKINRKKEVERVRSETGILKRLGRLAGMGKAKKNIVVDAVNSPHASPESIAIALREEKRFLRLRRELSTMRGKLAREDPGVSRTGTLSPWYQAGVSAKINASAKLDAVDAGYQAANFDLKKAELVKRAVDDFELESPKDWMWKNRTVTQGLLSKAMNQRHGREESLLDDLIPPAYDDAHRRPSQPTPGLAPESFPNERARLEKSPSAFVRGMPQLNDSGWQRTSEIGRDRINDTDRINRNKDLPAIPVPPIPKEASQKDTDLEVERARYNRASPERLALGSRSRDRNAGRGR
jgi:hypothetical protein